MSTVAYVNPKVLIVEDDAAVVQQLEKQLRDLGFDIQHESNGRIGLEAGLKGEFELIVVDLNLPGLGGLEVCRQLREVKPTQAIMILTGERGETTTVLGLELGADDYLQKPFRPLEFRARVRALLRRSSIQGNAPSGTETPANLCFGPLVIDVASKKLTLGGLGIELTPIEFDILELLASSPERVFSPEEILEKVWGHINYSQSQNVRYHVRNIRNKLLDAGAKGEYIVTKRGHGYYFVCDDF